MKLHELQYTEGARKARKRVGRGTSSGTGKTAGRGQKGQGARSGGGKKPGFEGGQTPLFMRLPKRGFTNFNRTEYAIVNLEQLNTFEAGAVVCPEALKEAGIIKKELDGVKVLGNGKLEKAITVKAHKFSKSAVAAIEAAGGKTEVILSVCIFEKCFQKRGASPKSNFHSRNLICLPFRGCDYYSKCQYWSIKF